MEKVIVIVMITVLGKPSISKCNCNCTHYKSNVIVILKKFVIVNITS